MSDHHLTPAPGASPPEEPRERAVAGLGRLYVVTPHAWATPSLAAVLVLCFAASVWGGVDLVSPTARELLEVGGVFGPKLVAGEWWRLLTSAFLHAGIVHLAFNLWAFWNAGELAERIYGNAAFLALYGLSAIGGSLVSMAVHPLIVGVGASGAIFGVYGALLAFALTHGGDVISAEELRHQRNSLVGFFAYNLAFGLSQEHIDLAGHAGGLLTGMAAGWLLRRDLQAPSANAWRRVWGALTLAAALVASAWGTFDRVARVPEVRAGRAADEASAAFDAHRYEEAVRLYTVCIEATGDDSCGFHRGLAHMALEHRDAALADLRAAVKRDDSANRRAALCQALAYVGGRDEATGEAGLKECTRALEMDPKASGALYARARLYMARREFEAALGDVTRALELVPSDREALTTRAVLFADLRRLDDAEKDCAAVLSLQQTEGSLTVCAEIARRRGDTTVALERATRSLAREPDEVDALAVRAWVLHETGDVDGALADLDHLLLLEPANARALNERGWYRIGRGDFAGGLEDADHSLALRPDNANTLGTRCFALVGLGRREEARKECARAVALAQLDVDRGMLAFIEGRHGEALRLWDDAARKRPATGRDLAPWIAKARSRAAGRR